MAQYWVPDYLDRFRCKGGACRHTCCMGWGISISMEEYFHLLGMNCPPALRKRLDGAFHLADHPMPERYALMTPNWLGDCPLHGPDGLCELHRQMGPGALPAVCRLYPRGIHNRCVPECSCSASCESVVEALFAEEAPLSFRLAELDAPPCPPGGAPDVSQALYMGTRRRVIEILQDRGASVNRRLMRLGNLMSRLQGAGTEAEKMAALGDALPESAVRGDMDLAMEAMLALGRAFVRDEDGFDAFHRDLNVNLALEAGDFAVTSALYRKAKARFCRNFPNWSRYLENLLVNHVFFDCFPFTDRHEGPWDEYVALCAAYCLLCFLAVGFMADETDLNPLADVTAAAFRLIEHTNFDRSGDIVLAQMGLSNKDHLDSVLAAMNVAE